MRKRRSTTFSLNEIETALALYRANVGNLEKIRNDMKRHEETTVLKRPPEKSDWSALKEFLRIHQYPNSSDALDIIRDCFPNLKINEKDVIGLRKELGQKGRPGRNKAPTFIHLEGCVDLNEFIPPNKSRN
jgi:hypothetical protein